MHSAKRIDRICCRILVCLIFNGRQNPAVLHLQSLCLTVTLFASCLTMDQCASTGTAIEIAGDSTKAVFEREVLPIMQQQEQLWPADVQTYEAFELYAGLVQSRAFHMLSENWLTGLAQEGLFLFPTNSSCSSRHHQTLAMLCLVQLGSLWRVLVHN